MKILYRAIMASSLSVAAISPAVAATGAAVFEQMPNPEIPPPFHGNWAREGQTCRNRVAPTFLRIMAGGIVKTDGAMRVLRIWLYPGDAPHFDHAIVDIVATGSGGGRKDSLILHLNRGGLMLSIRHKGEDDAKAIIYRKCTR